MLKHSLAAGLLACAALTPAAFAQDKQASTGGGNIQFIETIGEQQFRGSELIGQTVYNKQDETIGDIGDVLLDKSGKAAAVTIDVGGFLGIGAREVGIPFTALQFERAPERTVESTPSARPNDPSGKAIQDARSSTGGSPPTAGSGASVDPSGKNEQSAAQSQTSGGMSSQVDSANRSSQEASSSDSMLDNVRIVLNTTRDDLQNAPELKSPGEQQSESGASGDAGSGSSAPAK